MGTLAHNETNVEELARLAGRLYVEGPYLMRKMMHHRIRICPLERLLPHVPAGSSVLDIGCGAGLFLALLASTKEGITGLGFDASGEAIGTAHLMMKHLTADLRFSKLAAAEPWPEGLFDVVTLVDVLHHVDSAGQQSVVRRAVEKVKPGGVLLYKDMADQPWLTATMNRLHDLVIARDWIHYVPISRVDEWVSSLGLRRTHAEEISRLWYRHDLRVYVRAPTEK